MPAAARDPQIDAELADMAIAIANNPETRKGFAKLAEKAKINLRFNDVEAEERAVVAATEATAEVLAKAERKRQADETTARLNAQRGSLLKTDMNPDGRFTEDEIKGKLEPYMQAKGIADYNDAAILYAHENPVATPHPELASRGIWEMPKGDWVKDPRGMARKEAFKAVGDIMQKRSA